jgi:hypothetical protein
MRVIWTFEQTYARSSRRTLLFVVQMYVGGPPDVRFANRTADVCQKYQMYATF